MLKLNVGCGSRKRAGYVGVDKFAGPAVEVVAPAHRLPYAAGSVDEVATSHMVEHLPPHELGPALKEWKRVLKPGGRLEVRCPNFELYVREWLEADYDHRWSWGIRNLLGWQDRGDGYLTRNGFTAKRLRAVLEAHGFRVESCAAVETRTKKKTNVEWRADGDLLAVAVRP